MRCRNCIHFSELAAKGTGCCAVSASDPSCVRRINAADPGCDQFQPKRPAKRRRIAPATPSADAVLIAESIANGCERIAQAITEAFTNPEDGGTAWTELASLAIVADQINDHLEQ